MRIFLLGATGALGRHLVPVLVGRGHAVIGVTRSESKKAGLENQGAQAVVLDALDRKAVLAAMKSAEPEILIHQLTAIPSQMDIRHFDRDFEATNRLRTEGTDIALDAARVVGVRRVIAQSFAGWPYAREGGSVKAEEDPFDPSPPAEFKRTLTAIQHLEKAVSASTLEGLILRYAAFYGPGTSIARDGGAQVDELRRRRFPVIGSGSGVWSFIQIADAAAVTAAAVERGAPGIYNVADDDPATVAEWLPALAAAVGAPPPRRVPAWLARLIIGEHIVVMMTQNRGVSNRKAKAEFLWAPRFSSWRQGFVNGLG